MSGVAWGPIITILVIGSVTLLGLVAVLSDYAINRRRYGREGGKKGEMEALARRVAALEEQVKAQQDVLNQQAIALDDRLRWATLGPPRTESDAADLRAERHLTP